MINDGIMLYMVHKFNILGDFSEYKRLKINRFSKLCKTQNAEDKIW